MKLNKITLENYQGIKELSLDFNGNSMVIKGKNATGKTTIANAYSWLLTDKPINGEKGYTPKTRDGDGEAHHLEHSVEAEFEEDNGKGTFVIKKVFHEKWTKKHGQAADEFTGHVVDYYIDDVPVKMKDYNAFVDSIAQDQATLQLLLNVDAFTSMKWQDRRALLLEICGDVTDEDVILSSKELSELTDILANGSRSYTVDEYLAKAKAEMRKINKEIDSGIPERINEAKKAIPEGIENADRTELMERLNSIESSKKKLMDQKRALEATEEENAKQKKLNELEAKIEAARLNYMNECRVKDFEWKQQSMKLKTTVEEAQSLVSSTERSIRNAEGDLKYSMDRRNALIEQWKRVNASQWEGSEICPTCGQQLPHEKIEEAKANFNLEKSKKLEEINKMGSAVSKDSIKEQEDFITRLKSDLKTYGSDLLIAKQKLSKYEANKPVFKPFEETEAYAALKGEYDTVMTSFDADEMKKSKLSVINDSIASTESKLDKVKHQLFNLDIADRQTERIAELEEELRNKSVAYEELQRGVYLCEEFIKTKVEYIDKAITDVFSTVKFRMFETQINGGLKSCCDVMVPDGKGNYIPYASANNAARIRAGLEIIKVLSDHYGIHVPVFIDNAEGIDHAIEEEGMQIISLLVERDDDDKGQVITL